MKRRTLFLALASLVAGALPFGASAQQWPDKPIRFVMSAPAGSSIDVIGRTIGDKLKDRLGQPVIVDNKPGAAQISAVNAVTTAAPDGHTLLVATSGALSINPTVFKKLPYDWQKDLVPVALYLKSPFVLIVNPDLPVRNVQELIRYAKERPGKLSYSSANISSAPHLAGEMFKGRFDLDIVNVPYKNTPQSITDVATGVVQLAFAEAAASQPLIKDGRVRALAVSSLTRLPTLPEIAPFAEVSGAPDFEAVSWHALLARAGTPREIVARLHEEMKRATATPEVRERILGFGLIPVESPAIEAIQDYLKSEEAKWGGLVRKLGLAGSQ